MLKKLWGNKLSRGRKSRNRPSNTLHLGLEQLEDRTMMSVIVWANRAEFDTEFGARTAAARQVIDQVLLDWGAAIESFNYRKVGQSGWAPSRSYTINIVVDNLEAGKLASCKPVEIDDDGKPFEGKMTIDRDASGGMWYFDPSPLNDDEFPTPITPFASAGGPAGADLYTTVLHELGHGLGLAGNSDLAIQDRIRNHVFTFNNGEQAALVDAPDDDDDLDEHIDPSTHPNDLLNPGLNPSERRTISDLDARLLGEGFGYSIDLRSVYKRTFVTTYDANPTSPTFRKLTINGDLGTTFNTVDIFDEINLNVTAGDIFVDVNGYLKTIAASAVSSIEVLGKVGPDKIVIEATKNGIAVTIRGGAEQNSVFVGSRAHNLQNIRGNIDVFGGGTRLNFLDENNAAARTFSIFGRELAFSGSTARIRYSGSSDPAQNVYSLAVRGGSGGNTFSVGNSTDTSTRTQIFAGAANDIVNVFSASVRGVTIDGVAGVDRVTVGASFLNGLRDILGPVFVSNSNGFTNLILDDSGDTSASRNVRLRDTNVTGLGPAAIQFDPRGIQSLTVLASNDLGGNGNTIRVLNTPQNRARNLAVNLKSGRWNDRVDIEATSSSLFVDGQNADGPDGFDSVFVGRDGRILGIRGRITVSNQASHTALTIDNSLDNLLRAGTLSENSFRLFTTRIDFIENDLKSLTFFGGIRSTITVNDTPQNSRGTATTLLYLGAGIDVVNVRQTSGALTINGDGGLDTVNIGADGRVDQIAGAIDISNPPTSGRTTVNVDGSNEVIGHFVVLDSGSLRGLAPAEIRFVERDLAALTVSAGPYINTFNVINTPQNGLRNLSVTLNTGLGADTVRVQQISSSTVINGQNGADLVNVGLEGNMQGIANTLAITNASSRSTINLDNSADTLPRAVTLNVTDSLFGILGSVEGLSPGLILYRQADLRDINVRGGSGFDTFNVVNTAHTGVDPITTIYAGQGGDNIQVLGTTGRLVIDPQGNDNIITIGGPTGTTGGTLDRIIGDIVLEGDPEPVGNLVEIRDAASTGQYVYWMDSQRIYRTNLGGGSPTGNVYLASYRLNGLTLVGAGNGNGFQIDGTPSLYASDLVNPIYFLTGNGNDHVAIFGSSNPLDVALGSGIYQTVRLGDAAHSLDAIQGDVSIAGAGFIDTFVSDEASTTAHIARIDRIAEKQRVERWVYENGQYRTLNSMAFQFADQGRISYQAGRVVTGDYNQGDVLSVVANTEVVVNGGPSYDVFSAGLTGDTSGIQGPLTFNSPDADNDFAYFYDRNKPNPQTYTLRTNPLDSSGVRVERLGMSTITYNGLAKLDYLLPQVGGNITNIQSLPANLFLNMAVANGDALTLGSTAPSLGGTMANIVGKILIASYGGFSAAVSLTLDDSGNTTTARDVTILNTDINGPMGVITGMTGSETLLFRDYENYDVNIRGGALDDSFVMSGSAMAADVSIDGGAGNDILVGSGGNWLTGGAGRDLLVAGGLASVLDGGLDEDILIGGRINDFSLSNLNAIRMVWTQTGDYNSRVATLRSNLLADDRVTGNRESDTLTGGLDSLDLFFGELETDLFAGDLMTNREESEYLVPLF